MRLGVDFSILNQKGTPAFYSDIFANRPAAGFAGRVFISTDTGAIYEDTGSAWTLIADAGAGTTGTLEQVTTNGKTTTQGISITGSTLNFDASGVSANPITMIYNTSVNRLLTPVVRLYGNTSITTNYVELFGTNATSNRTVNFPDASGVVGLSAAALTAGSVVFAGAGGVLSQDNTNLFWDNTTKYLGIGPTGTPTAPLDIHNGTVGQLIQLNATSTNNSNIAFLNGGVGKWRIGNVYNGGANDFNIHNIGLTTNAVNINNTTNAATFNGQIIGTNTIGFLNTPTTGTDVTSFKASNNSGYITMGIDNSTAGNYNNGAYSRWIYADGPYPMDFYTQALPRMRIAANGSVLVGLTNPSSLTAKVIAYDATGDNQFVAAGLAPSLRLYNTVASPTINGFVGMSSATDNFILGSASGDMCIGTSTAGKIYIGSGTTTVNPAMTILNSGSVGIGTSSPSAKLTVIETGSTNGAYIENSGGSGYGLQVNVSTNSGTYYIAKFRSTGVDRMRILDNGVIQIGGTATTSKLGVTDGAKSTTAVPFTLSSDDGASSMQLYFERVTNTQFNIQSIEQGVSYRSIYLNPNGGAVYAGAVRLDTLSDKRVKDNIQPIENALNKILSITGKKFHLLDEEENKLRYGFIAQELEGVLDEFVIKTDMTFKKDDLEVKNVLSVDNWGTSWAALLVEAMKEMNNKITDLEQQVLNLSIK